VSWRLKWAMQQFFDRQLRLRNRELLNNPAAYYASILLKMVPGIYPPPLQLRFRHSPHSFPVGSFMTAFIYKEIFADSDYDIALAMPRPSILDVGANTGLFALRMKQLYPEARIACFEPEENNFTQLERPRDSKGAGSKNWYRRTLPAPAKHRRAFYYPPRPRLEAPHN